jgi:glucose 1-dehydrogenase
MGAPDRPVTVVTGGGRGIGAATVLELSRDGHDVALSYRVDAGTAAATVAAATQFGGRCVAIRADVTRDEDVDALFSEAADQLGAVTGLVNNAGVTAHIGDLADTPVEVIRQVIDVNLLGAVLCARQAARVMSLRRGGPGGAIVNVSSAGATLGSTRPPR